MVFGTPKIPQPAWLGTVMLFGLGTQKIERAHLEDVFPWKQPCVLV